MFPPILDQFPVVIDTNISDEECSFLLNQGIFFGGLSMERETLTPQSDDPLLLDLCIDVNAYHEKSNFDDPKKHLRSQNKNLYCP